MEVSEVIAALQDGQMTVEEAAEDFRGRDWPTTPPAPTVNGIIDERADPEVEPSGSFSEVEQAFVEGRLDQETYGTLAEAAAEAIAGAPSQGAAADVHGLAAAIDVVHGGSDTAAAEQQ
jgi:hypothetical protein